MLKVLSEGPPKKSAGKISLHSGQRGLDLLKHPTIRSSVQVTVIAVETAMEDALKQTSPLATHDRIAYYRLEVAVGSGTSKYHDLPFTLGIIGIPVWVVSAAR